MKHSILFSAIIAMILTVSIHVQAQPSAAGYTPPQENVEARQKFRDSRFGIFLHWGLYSMMAQGEWYMNSRNIDCHEYAKMAGGFYPSKFDAAAWVAAIKASGAKYICITSRHHDGFSMFGTHLSDYNIVDATPFKRDILKELADECHKQGITLNLYYSHLDWTRDDYYPLGRTGHGTGRTEHGDWNDYYNFMNGQLTELLTSYGPIGAIWFDGLWDRDGQPDFDWRLPEQYDLIHRLQPSCLIGNNHHMTPFAGEDIQIFERDLPGENKAGLSGQDVSPLPLETCETMNGMWGYKIADQEYKTVDDLVRFLVRAAGMDANLLLNIGPQPDGCLPAIALERLRGIGEWVSVYGNTIFGTRGGPIPPHDWGVTTTKDDKVYVHILDLKDNALFLPLASKIRKASLFADGSQVRFSQDKDGVLLRFDAAPKDVDYVVELVLGK